MEGDEAPRISVGLSREQVKLEAERHAASLVADELYNIGPPPEPHPVLGLYHLLQELPKDIIVERALLHDPDAYMEVLEDLEAEGELGARIMTAIGPWVAYQQSPVRLYGM